MPNNDIGFALTKCFVCGGDSDILINTMISEEHAEHVRSMHGKVVNHEPCNECKKNMERGVVVIAADPDKSDDDSNPYRTGGWWLVKDRAIENLREILGDDSKGVIDDILKKRITFMDERICREVMGLYDMKPMEVVDDI